MKFETTLYLTLSRRLDPQILTRRNLDVLNPYHLFRLD